jgi:thymidylate kinase
MADKPGMVIILEGLDLSGKTTLARFLQNILQRSGHQAVLVRRKYKKSDYEDVLEAKSKLFKMPGAWEVPSDIIAVCLCLEFLIIYQEKVIPPLREGKIVIVESWWLKAVCRTAIEVEHRHLQKHLLDDRFEGWMLNLFPYFTGFPYPQQVFFLDVEPAVCWERLQSSDRKGKGVVESMDKETFIHYQTLVREKMLSYKKLLNWVTVKSDNTCSLEESLENASKVILDAIGSCLKMPDGMP